MKAESEEYRTGAIIIVLCLVILVIFCLLPRKPITTDYFGRSIVLQSSGKLGAVVTVDGVKTLVSWDELSKIIDKETLKEWEK